MKSLLESFFDAKSIALIGASNDKCKIGNILLKKLKNQKGKTILINKTGGFIEGKKSFKNVNEYKKNVDLAVIVVPSKKVPKVLEDCGKKRIKNIIIISSGFSEDGNFFLERKIKKIKEKYNFNLLGPNCFGIINPKKNIDLTFSNKSFKKGDTVFLSQSGTLGSYILDFGIGLRGFVSLGNMVGLNFSDWIEYFEKDRKTKKIVCYIEKLQDGKRFIEVCKKSTKKIFVVKGGKTKKGKEIIFSNTGSISADEEIYSGAFKQAGVIEKEILISVFGVKEENILYYLKGKNIFLISNSGAASVLLTDRLGKEGYVVEREKDFLKTANEKDYKNGLRKIKKSYDSILLILTPQIMSNPKKIAEIILESKYKNKILACFLGKNSFDEALKIFRKNGISYITKAI